MLGTIHYEISQNLIRIECEGAAQSRQVKSIVLVSSKKNPRFLLSSGNLSNYFKVSGGICQGFPLSPLLFVLAVEMLALEIPQNQRR